MGEELWTMIGKAHELAKGVCVRTPVLMTSEHDVDSGGSRAKENATV